MENQEEIEIIEIGKRLERGEISHKDARLELCELFGVEYKTRYKGSAIVKSKKQNTIYDGLKLPIIGLYMTYKNGNGMGIFPDGSREFKLSLVGTPWGNDGYTVMHESDLEILELNID